MQGPNHLIYSSLPRIAYKYGFSFVFFPSPLFTLPLSLIQFSHSHIISRNFNHESLDVRRISPRNKGKHCNLCKFSYILLFTLFFLHSFFIMFLILFTLSYTIYCHIIYRTRKNLDAAHIIMLFPIRSSFHTLNVPVLEMLLKSPTTQSIQSLFLHCAKGGDPRHIHFICL